MKARWMGVIATLVLAAGILHAAPALAQSASCFIAPGDENTYIFVRELDQDGNPLNELNSGWVKQGDQMPVISRTGQISINYQLASSDKLVMMDPVSCSDGAVIQVP
jgi:hypothetical protein